MALCIAEYCHPETHVSVIEGYWEGHLATGSVADPEWETVRPVMSYERALMYAQEDVKSVGGESKVPYAVKGEPLNVTSLVREDDVLPGLGTQAWFEEVERAHSRNGYVLSFHVF